MSEIWELYENMNEIVYVADIFNYEIIYMNRKLRKKYNIDSVEEIKGKKCYEIFQNSSFPCSMCNNKQLKVGFFEEWSYFNPIFKQSFYIKDTLIEKDGKKYRFEIAIDMSSTKLQEKIVANYAKHEAMINDGLKLALSSTNPEQSIMTILEYIGKSLKGERTYIFEESHGELSNTYEWCANDVTPQKDNLQKLPVELAKMWFERFYKYENIIISNIDDIKEIDPPMYDLLYPQEIHSLVASPLIYNGNIVGFYGVDNPPAEQLENISKLFLIIGSFIVALLRRKELFKELEHIGFYDQLTGFENRHSMKKYFETISKDNSFGVVYCDVMGLKKVNDTLGHNEGDNLLLRACECIRKVFPNNKLFRIGGDEFLVVCYGINEKTLNKKVFDLKKIMKERNALMAMGVVWKPHIPTDFDALLMQADSLMYADKKEHYSNIARKL